MNIRTKLILSVGILAGMIILLVALSVVNLQILTATEPTALLPYPVCNVLCCGFLLRVAFVSLPVLCCWYGCPVLSTNLLGN